MALPHSHSQRGGRRLPLSHPTPSVTHRCISISMLRCLTRTCPNNVDSVISQSLITVTLTLFYFYASVYPSISSRICICMHTKQLCRLSSAFPFSFTIRQLYTLLTTFVNAIDSMHMISIIHGQSDSVYVHMASIFHDCHRVIPYCSNPTDHTMS